MTWFDALTAMTWLNALAALATIFTAIAGLLAYCISRRTNRRLNAKREETINRRVKKLEELLIAKTAPRDDFLCVEQLAAAMGCTVEQVIEAASRSKMVEPYPGPLGDQHCYRYMHQQVSTD